MAWQSHVHAWTSQKTLPQHVSISRVRLHYTREVVT